MIKFSKLSFLAILWMYAAYPEYLYAGHITIYGKAEINSSIENGILKLHGKYIIENRGDEIAFDVYPKLELGDWSWKGSPHELSKREKEIWDIDFNIPLSQAKLECKKSSSCKNNQAHLVGEVPLKIYRFYSDQNGYQFSAPEIVVLSIGALNGEMLSSLSKPSINADMKCTGYGFSSLCIIEIENKANVNISIGVSIYSSKNLKVNNDSEELFLLAGQSKRLEFNVENISAFADSTYPIFGLIEWEDRGISNVRSIPDVIYLNNPPVLATIIFGIIIATSLVIFVIYLSVFGRNADKFQK